MHTPSFFTTNHGNPSFINLGLFFWKSTLLNLQDELKSAQENFNAVQMQFKYGMADSIDIMDANTLLVTAQRRISDAEYTYYLSVLKILYTKGDLVQYFLNQG